MADSTSPGGKFCHANVGYVYAAVLTLAMAGFLDDIADLVIDAESHGSYESGPGDYESTVLGLAGDGLVFWRAQRYLGILKRMGIPDFGVNPMNQDEKYQFPSPPFLMLVATEAIASLTGFDVPYDGHSIRNARDKLLSLQKQLDSAFPDDSWQGPAAQAYVSQVGELQEAVSKLMELDALWACRAHDAAHAVNDLRMGLEILKIFFAIADWVWTLDWECTSIAIGIFCVGGVAALIGISVVYSNIINRDQERRVKSQVNDYRDVIPPDIGSPAGGSLRAGVIAGQEARASDFAACLADASETMWTGHKASLSSYAYQYSNIAKLAMGQAAGAGAGAGAGFRRGRRSAVSLERPTAQFGPEGAVYLEDVPPVAVSGSDARGARLGAQADRPLVVETAMAAPGWRKNPVEGSD